MRPSMKHLDTIILGAGAAGLFCAGSLLELSGAAARPEVLVIDHARAPGEKIRISGGGRCNFTNLATSRERFLSGNPRFCASALAGYRPEDFTALVDRAGIAWHEKTLGQLFCDGSARQIVDLLTGEAEFDSPKTLAAFALGLTLFAITFLLNMIALSVVRRYREAYE